jgi:uncharacterized protein (DUF302 family)
MVAQASRPCIMWVRPVIIRKKSRSEGEVQVKMTTKQVTVPRVSIISSKSFEEIVARLEAVVSRPPREELFKDVASAKTSAELEQVINRALGPSGFMEFIRFDFGEIMRQERGEKAPRSLRLLIGNPLIAKRLIGPVPDAGSYAPVTILIDQRADGVHLSYDRMAGFLAPYGSPEALKVAADLDAKIESLLMAAA